MKNIVILGSTGSIGTQTLNVIRKNPDKFQVTALAANTNARLLASQANEFHPKYVGLVCSDNINELNLKYNCNVMLGNNVLRDIASISECDTVVCSVVGMSGFEGVLSAINAKKQIALANKEVLVSGGQFVMSEAKRNGVNILPVDSEHSAVWQCLEGKDIKDVSQIILTASGGPFRKVTSLEELRDITVEQAVSHPNWKMGKKISVDSATMMNKGLEIIEARWLFDIENIDYVIHPQSIVHSMIRFKDGSILAQISKPSMELPIQVALSYPERIESNEYTFNFDHDLTFERPKEKLFSFPSLAKTCLKIGLSAPCILNAANEAAVALFLSEKIKFTDIMRIVNETIEKSSFSELKSYEDIVFTHEETMSRVNKDYKLLI